MRTVAVALSVGMVLSVVGCAASAPPQVVGRQDTYWKTAAQPSANQPWIVGLGDSYISGEAGRWASNGSDNAQYNADGGWYVGDTSQVYGDSPDGTESAPWCHRTATAPMFIGQGWNSENLACSGALTTSYIGRNNRVKPGIDFMDVDTKWGHVSGQALQLEQFAKSHDVKAVALSIGGNDMGFSSIIETCVLDWLTPFEKSTCNDSDTINQMVNEVSQQTISNSIATAISNINLAMRKAGKSPADWRLVYQLPPSPIPTSDKIAYPDNGYSREIDGGCPMYNADIDWANHVLIPFLYTTTELGIQKAKAADPSIAPVTLIDTQEALQGHRLCESGTQRPDAGTGIPPDAFAAQTEWVRLVSLVVAKQYPTATEFPEAMHPTFFGQRALAACVRGAVETPRNTTLVQCELPATPAFDDTDQARAPDLVNMRITAQK